MPWFTSKGQCFQVLFSFLAVCLAGVKAWPDMKANAYFTGGAILFYILVALVIGSIVHLILASGKKIAPPTLEGNAAASYHEARAGEFKEQVNRLIKERDDLLSEQARINQHRVDLLGSLAQAKEANAAAPVDSQEAKEILVTAAIHTLDIGAFLIHQNIRRLMEFFPWPPKDPNGEVVIRPFREENLAGDGRVFRELSKVKTLFRVHQDLTKIALGELDIQLTDQFFLNPDHLAVTTMLYEIEQYAKRLRNLATPPAPPFQLW